MNPSFKLPITSLSTAILVGISLLAFIVILLMSVVQVYGIPFTQFTGQLQTKQEEVFNQLQKSADLEAAYLQRVINEKARDARILANRPDIRLSVAEIKSIITNHKQLQNTDSLFPQLNYIFNQYEFLNADLLNYARNYGMSVSVDIVESFEYMTIASSKKNRIGKKNEALADIYAEFSVSRERYADVRNEQGSLQLVIAQKIFMPEEELKPVRVAGLLLLVVDIDALIFQYALKHKESSTFETLLVNNKGFAISKLKFKEVVPLSYKIEALPAQLSAQGNEGIIATTDYRDEPVLAAFRHIRLSTTLGIGMVLKRDQTEVFSPVYNTLYFNIVFLVIAFVILLSISWILVQQLTEPLKQLDKIVQQVELGNLTVRGEVKGTTEIRRFTSTFNLMLNKVSGWHDELNQKVILRTDELEKKNSELERFAYTVSHDLKSPLVTIKGFIGLLEKDAIKVNKESMFNDISRINEATNTMKLLLDELLEFSRIGRVVNPYEDIIMNDLVEKTIELLSGSISKNNTQFTIAPNLPVTFGDLPRIREVLQNLIENAVKFMGEQPNPHIEISSYEKQGETIYFVKDNGLGIDKPYQEKVFLMFERLNSDIEGTGMGLALVKRIVETHGGRIWIESDGKDCGSSFYFMLPQKMRIKK